MYGRTRFPGTLTNVPGAPIYVLLYLVLHSDTNLALTRRQFRPFYFRLTSVLLPFYFRLFDFLQKLGFVAGMALFIGPSNVVRYFSQVRPCAFDVGGKGLGRLMCGIARRKSCRLGDSVSRLGTMFNFPQKRPRGPRQMTDRLTDRPTLSLPLTDPVFVMPIGCPGRQSSKLRGSIIFAVGFFFVFTGHPIIGLAIEVFGFLNLFG